MQARHRIELLRSAGGATYYIRRPRRFAARSDDAQGLHASMLVGTDTLSRLDQRAAEMCGGTGVRQSKYVIEALSSIVEVD